MDEQTGRGESCERKKLSSNFEFENFDEISNLIKIAHLKFRRILWKCFFGAVHNCANLLDNEKMLQNEYLLASIGFDTS